MTISEVCYTPNGFGMGVEVTYIDVSDADVDLLARTIQLGLPWQVQGLRGLIDRLDIAEDHVNATTYGGPFPTLLPGLRRARVLVQIPPP